jgi:Transposase C of IS166 homeodomain
LGPLHHLRSTHRIAEKLQELIAQKDKRIRELEADKQQQAQEIKLLKEKVDLLIRRLFGSKSEKLDSAQLELLLRDLDLGKADASAEKAEVAPNVEVLKPVAKRPNNNQRRERWPKELAVEQEVIEPEEVRNNPEAFRCIGEEITEMLDYRPAKFFRRQIIRRKFVRKQETELPPIIAPLPESLQQRCIAAPGLLAGIITLFAEPLDYAARHAHIGKKPYYQLPHDDFFLDKPSRVFKRLLDVTRFQIGVIRKNFLLGLGAERFRQHSGRSVLDRRRNSRLAGNRIDVERTLFLIIKGRSFTPCGSAFRGS